MLRSRDAWLLIADNAPKGEWLKVGALYAIVESKFHLDASDRESVSNGASARWQRTVRNALQSAKKRGEITFERGKGFRFETCSTPGKASADGPSAPFD